MGGLDSDKLVVCDALVSSDGHFFLFYYIKDNLGFSSLHPAEADGTVAKSGLAARSPDSQLRFPILLGPTCLPEFKPLEGQH